MDELVISDKRYISTRRAGKEHGYHSDYIGQLIRSGKVRGQKVGRAWYVEEESLATYLGKEHSAPAIVNVLPETPAGSLPKVEEIEPESVQEEPEIKVVPPVVEAQKQKQDEYLIPIHKPIVVAEEKPAPPAHQEIKVVPITSKMIFTANEVGEGSDVYKGLKYIPDDEPLLPEIQTTVSVSRQAEPIAEAPRQGNFTRSKRSMRPIIAAAVVVGVGAITVALTTAAGAVVSSTVSVIDGQTASVSYTLNQ